VTKQLSLRQAIDAAKLAAKQPDDGGVANTEDTGT
jgi:hypothetical protein